MTCQRLVRGEQASGLGYRFSVGWYPGEQRSPSEAGERLGACVQTVSLVCPRAGLPLLLEGLGFTSLSRVSRGFRDGCSGSTASLEASPHGRERAGQRRVLTCVVTATPRHCKQSKPANFQSLPTKPTPHRADRHHGTPRVSTRPQLTPRRCQSTLGQSFTSLATSQARHAWGGRVGSKEITTRRRPTDVALAQYGNEPSKAPQRPLPPPPNCFNRSFEPT